MTLTRRAFILSLVPMPAVYPVPPMPLAYVIDLPHFLHCLSAVETNHTDTAIGSRGERSRYQISQTVWTQHSSAPFSDCRGLNARAVASAHLQWLQKHLPSPSVFWLAYAWNAGLRTTLSVRPDRTRLGPRSFAVRLSNLYYAPRS